MSDQQKDHSEKHSQSNLAWNDESLILFFYGELNAVEAQAIVKELENSAKLRHRYAELEKLLAEDISKEIPEPSDNLNHNIMAAVTHSVNQLAAEQQTLKAAKRDRSSVPLLSRLVWFFTKPKLQLVFSLSLVITISISLFYFGRWSAETDTAPNYADAGSSPINSGASFTQAQSERVLYSSLTQHIDASSRLLMMVSNADANSNDLILQRSQHLSQLISFNRLYRRMVENSGDRQLAQLLFQMESVLLELKNSSHNLMLPSDLKQQNLEAIQGRLDSSDLLFKLKVSNKKIAQNKI